MEKHLFQQLPKQNPVFQQLMKHSPAQPEQQHSRYPLAWVSQASLEPPWGPVDSLPRPVHQGVSLFLGRLVPQIQLVRLVLLLPHSAQCRL